MTLSTNFELAAASGPRGVCPECGEDDPAAMTKHGICYECSLRRVGKPTTENHHIFGPDIPITVAIPANVHRALNARWAARQPLLKYRSDNPVIEAARLVTIVAELAEVCGARARRTGQAEWLTKLVEIIAAACRKGANWLLALCGWLAEKLGADWHRDSGLPAWT